MATPQQPELRRSEDNALVPGTPADEALPGNQGGPTGPVPEANQPGHHPEVDQDKPDPAAFVAKAKEVAARTEDEAPAAKKAPAAKAKAEAAPTAPAATQTSAPSAPPEAPASPPPPRPVTTAPPAPSRTPVDHALRLATVPIRLATLPARTTYRVVVWAWRRR